MKKKNNFKVNLSSVQRASNKSIDSKYKVLGEIKRGRKITSKDKTAGEPIVTRTRQTKKKKDVVKGILVEQVMVDGIEGNDVKRDNHKDIEQRNVKEKTLKHNLLEFFNKKSKEIKDIFSGFGSYITELIKDIESKDKEIKNAQKLLEEERKKSLTSENELQRTKEDVLEIQSQLSKKDELIKTLENKIKILRNNPPRSDRPVKKEKLIPQIKNMVINADGSKDFNFGIRKPVTNCEELLTGNAWEKYLINKWVHEYNPTEERDVFYKHILQNSRVIQIVYSGLDILGDGIYVLYKARLYENKEDFYVEPQEFNLMIGSFECEDFLGELLERKLITPEEKEVLSICAKREKFKTSIPYMNEKILPNK